MKNRSILFLLLFLPGLVMGQKLSKDFTVTPSKGFQVVDAKNKQYFSVGGGFTISVKTRGEMVTIQRFDSNAMKEVSRKEYKDFPKYTKVQAIVQAGDKLHYVFEAYNKKAKTFTVSSREIDTQSGTFGDINELFTTSRPVAAGPPVFGQMATGFTFPTGSKFQVQSSFDGSKILIQYRLKPKSRKDAVNYDELGYYVFDNNFKQIWGKEEKMPYTEKEMNNLAYCVTSDGTAHMLAYVREAKKFELFTFTANDFTTNQLDVDGALVFQKFDLREDDNGNIAAVGLYANGIDVKFSPFGGLSTSFNTNGIYYFKFDKNGKILDSRDYEFSLEFINEYKTSREKGKSAKREAKGKAGIPDLIMNNFYIDNGGNMILVAERAYVRNEFMGPKQQMVWHYSNVVMTKIDKNGDVVWMKKLPKNQAGTRGQGGMGIKYVAGTEHHYVMFLDNVKNAKLTVGRAPVPHKDGKGGYLTTYKVNDATGDVEKHNILNVLNIKGIEAFQFATSRIFDVDDTTFMLETYIKGKKDAMIKMELNQ